MEFTERQHAFISASFYRGLRDQNFHNFRAAFRMATQIYAQQRGSRMAQRAIRDGQALDFATYGAYGEWEYTDDAIEGLDTRTVTFIEGDDLKIHAFNCPWSAQYKEMGLSDGGIDYCDDLDKSIVRGFNPSLTYEVLQTQYKEREFCIHYLHNASVDRDIPRDKTNLLSFEFHCAHIFHTFFRVMVAVYGLDGSRLGDQVLEEFAAAYGREKADKLLEYRGVNFSYIE